jgi:hypothetical protein
MGTNDGRQSVTETLQQFLENDVPENELPGQIVTSSSSILENAILAGVTLQEYIKQDPARAIKEAEASVAEWLKIQSSAAIHGCIVTDNGNYPVGKNAMVLINERVNNAFKQLDLVNQISFSTYTSGEKRREHLTRVLYNRAVYKGDTRALMYLIDRVDGRPVESRAADLDYDNAYNVYQILRMLFKQQLEVLNSGSGTKVICCSRRAGKTMLLVAVELIECLRTANTTCLYIGETQEQTEMIVESTANQIIDKYKLRDKKGKRLDWKRFDNGSRIIIRGLSNTKDPDQIRGHKAKIIVIDEFFHLKSELLEYLQREVLQPMQMDYADDYMFLCAGTPPSIKGTYGEWAWKNWDCPHFMWTFRENPHPVEIQQREEYVERVLHEKGLTWDSPFARREYGGEWIYDDDLLLYPEIHTYDPAESLPSFNIDMVLFGIDYGVSDNDTLIGIAWDTMGRRGYVFHEDKFNRLDIRDRTVSQLEYLKGQVQFAWEKALSFFPTLGDKEANKRILWVADDNDQHLTDYFNINCRVEGKDIRLNIMNAHKTDKVFMFDKIRDLLRTANLLLPEGGKTARECQQTVLKRGINGQVYPEVDDKIYHPDLLPGLRYALYMVIGNENEHKNKGDYDG